MSRGNRNMAAKMSKAKAQRSDWMHSEMARVAGTEKSISDPVRLISALASRDDVMAIGGRIIRKVKDGVTGQNVTKRQPAIMTPAIISAHW